MDPTRHALDTLIVLSSGQASFYDFIKTRQEAGGRTLVLLDRRQADRRQDDPGSGTDGRRRSERRQTPEAALALMSVLGFMVLHRDRDRWTV